MAEAPNTGPDEINRLTADIHGMQLNDFVARPGFGKDGKAIKVKANMYPVKFKGAIKHIIHYDVVINPLVKVANQKKPAALLGAVFRQLTHQESKGEFKAVFEAIAFDGRQNAFSPVPFPVDQVFEVGLPDEGEPVTTVVNEPQRRFKVVIKKVATIDATQLSAYCKGDRQSFQVQEIALTTIMSMNILLRSICGQYEAVGGGGNRFFDQEDRVPLPGGAIVGKGFFQSLRPTNAGFPAVNLDTAYTAFIQEGPMIDVAKRVLGLAGVGGGGGGRGGARGGRGGARGGFGGGGSAPLTQLNPSQIMQLKKVLKGAKFSVTHRNPNQTFTVAGFSSIGANAIKFRDVSNKETTVAQYFKTAYNINLQFPNLPCVQYKKNMVPMELVIVKPNHSIPPLRLTSDQTAEMIKVSATDPTVRMNNIDKWRSKLDYSANKKVAAWGLEISKDMMMIDARVLQPPKIGYGKNQSVNASFGSWNLVGKQFYKPGAPLVSWSVVSFDRFMQEGELQNFIGFFVKALTAVGVNIPNKTPPIISRFDVRDIGNIKVGLKEAAVAAYKASKKDPQLILCILPSRDKVFYEELKRAAMNDLKLPLPTQCLQSAKLRNERGLPQYCGNVAMKVQLKLGGNTHNVGLQDLPGVTDQTIIFGADVTHPPMRGGGENVPPSIVAVVATTNGQNNAYRAEIRLQEGRTEIIQDMQGICTSLLKQYRASNNNNPPTNIIFYRDGVSEGQYQEVVEKEVAAIKAACTGINANYRPNLTWVICGKRHHIRFFGAPNDVDRTRNLPAGLVVDRGVTHPFAFDFYLQAHSGLIGTARPTHYIVLVDDNKFTPDQFQNLTNSLCYQFARATRSVSLVPACYYADIICSQARPMVYDLESLDNSTVASGSRGAGGSSRPAFDPMLVQRRILTSPAFANVSWFM